MAIHGVEEIGERIRDFRKSCTGFDTQQAFSQALGIDQQRLSGYENGTRVPHRVIAALVRLGASPYWLLFGEGPMRGAPQADEEVRAMEVRAVNVSNADVSARQLAEFYVLPLYADEVAAGQPLEVRDTEIEGPAIIHRAWCPHPAETDYVRVHSTGTSMEPTVPAGSIVTIDRAENDPERLLGRVVAIALREGGVTLKRLRRTERGGYVGVPDNPGADHRPVHLEEGDRVLGLVRTVHARIG
jgi:SOS-response transcriptional repressor LexA